MSDLLPEVVGRDLRDTLGAYEWRIREFFGEDLIGLYLYGSLAYDAFDPATSDVDVAVLHRRDLDATRKQALAVLHERFGQDRPAAARQDVSFVPLRLVGDYGEDSLPYYRDGLFHRDGGGDVNLIMWHTLRERGVTVCGRLAAEIVPPTSREQLEEEMYHNLAFLRRRMPLYVATGTAETVFGVLSLCRVLHTLQTGEIVGKVPAAHWAIRNLNLRWRPLIKRACRRYEDNNLRDTDVLLRTRAIAFAIHETAGIGATTPRKWPPETRNTVPAGGRRGVSRNATRPAPPAPRRGRRRWWL